MPSPSIIEALRNCPRGRLSYERTSSHSPKQNQTTKEAKSQVLESSYVDDNATTLAGSLADVSSVLEDVTNEMCDFQVQRLASVFKRVQNLNQKNKADEVDSEENSKDLQYVWMSPFIEDEFVPEEDIVKELPKKVKPKIPVIAAEFSKMSLISNEMSKFEEERKMAVENKINERRKRLSLELEQNRRRSLLEMEQSLKKIKADVAQQAIKEKEAEDKHFSKLQKSETVNQAEIAARQAREALIEKNLQRAKQMEADKLAKQRKLQEQINVYRESLVSSWPSILMTIDQNSLNKILQSYNLKCETFDAYLQTVLTASNKEQAIENLESISLSFAQLIENFQAEQIKIAQEEQEHEEQKRIKAELDKQTVLELEQREKAQQEQAKAAQIPQNTPIPSQKQSEISQKSSDIYKSLLEFREQYLTRLKGMTVPKEFKFACQKAVTTPLNAISDVSAEHLKDKLDKFTALTSGQPVQATENTRFQANSEAELIYAKNHLAKKFVSHGEEVVATKTKNAFIAASMIVAIWAKHPDFGQVFLANLYECCPFLIPRYTQRKAGESDAEYFKSIGYCIGEGVIEDKTMFLKRMTGLARMYAAITVSR